MNDSSLGARVRESRKAIGLSQLQLAEQSGLTQPTISSIERGATDKTLSVVTLADILKVNALWLETGMGEPTKQVRARAYQRSADGRSSPEMEYEIQILSSRGSCGGGAVGKPDVATLWEEMGAVIKDQRFFAFHKVEPGNVIGVIADGDGNANFIVHGDTVLFSTAQADRIVSGELLLLDTADGPVIKRAHRKADGSLVLSFDATDKRRYPDEEYTAAQADGIKCLGRYIYRQG